MMVTKRPVILLDVDGPLNPNKPSEGFVRYVARLGYNRYTVWLNKQHGEWVKALAEETGADLMWASTWNDHANEHIGPRIGLPRLPIVVMSERMLSDEVVERMNAAPRSESVAICKAGCVAVWERKTGRPFAWFDDLDGIEDELRRHPILTENLVVQVDPTYGLQKEHIAQARKWLLDITA